MTFSILREGDSSPRAATLAGVLRLRAERHPERWAYTFLEDGEREAGRLTFCELDRRARAVAAALLDCCAPGDRALLLLPPGLDFVAAFFGCLYAGVVAVPAYPPASARRMPRLATIAGDCGPRAVLATSSPPRLRDWARADPRLAGLPWIDARALGEDLAGAFRDPGVGPDDLAFLQYTSGSTSAPKGVRVRHGNLMANEALIRDACGHSEDSVFVTWLPLYHDLGLIGNVLQAAYVGAPCVMMAPPAFLHRPLRWLEAVSRYRGTTSGGPNFSYDLCAAHSGDAPPDLDLSCWRIAFNGAEPVRAGTLARFAEAFRGQGFRPSALYPCYGLAEATLMVAGGSPSEPPPAVRFAAGELERGWAVEATGPAAGARELVSSGRPLGGQDVRVVDPGAGTETAPGEVGEIWVAGPSVADGYWERPEETAAAFGARLAAGGEGFLRTGDLGFFHGGELFVAGRLKDLVILRGRNLYPQDLELAAERCHPALRPGGGAAFSVDLEGGERLVLVLELERGARRRDAGGVEEIAAAVRRAVAEEHEAQVHEVVLTGPGGVPRTTSGKVQRRACRALYLEGGLEAVGRSRLERAAEEPAAADEAEGLAGIEGWLGRRVAASLGVAVDPGQPLTGYGLDSLAAIELGNAVQARFGVALAAADLLDGMTLSEAAERVREGRAAGEPERIPRTEGGDHPLSWGQRGLWFLHRLAPESPAYNLAGAGFLPEPVDEEALERALQALVDRHAVLRSTFVETTAGPRRWENGGTRVAFARVDAAGLGEERLREILAAEAFRPFDLASGPLFRAALFVRPEESALVLAVHHIAADFASLALLVRELGELYSRFATGPEDAAGPPAPELRYADFVRWEGRRSAGAEAERRWSYWRDRLRGVPPLDPAPDRPRRPGLQAGAALASLRLPAGLAEVRALARERGCTPFMVLAAAWCALLGRRSGQDDFLLGAPATGRGSERFADVVGYFVNPLPLRADLSGDPTGAGFLERVRRELLGAFAHELPFPLIAERLGGERDADRPQLLQTLLAFQQPPAGLEGLAGFALGQEGAELNLGRLALRSVALPNPAAQLDLLLTAAPAGPRGDELGLSLQVSTALFDPATGDRMLGHLGCLLAALATAPERPLWELPLLTGEERAEILAGEAGAAPPAIPDGGELGLHGLFEERAARSPEALALVAGSERLTYGELSRRSGALARRLRHLGVGPEVRVAVCLRRSPRLIEALLGVLRAGGAYIPVDPAYPAERQAFLLADSAPGVLLTESALAPGLPAFGGPVLLLDAQDGPDEGPGERHAAHPEQLAYLIYTSGSTGLPKGVAIRHSSAVARVSWALAAYPPAQLRGVLAATSVCFDLSVFEIFVPLAAGGAVVLADDALALAGLPAAGEVTLINTVPSAMAALARAGAVPSSVRAVNLAGEPLRGELAAALYELPGVEAVHNLYGPSEDTTYSTGATVPRRSEREPAIGRPLPGTRAHVLDLALEPLPAGIPGQLWLGGAGLARGYFGRPDLTADRFRPDPFGTVPGGRLYPTGDLARRRPDGELDFLGRLDHQVKVRGFRVELGEIEAALIACPGVADAVVTAAGEGAGRRLVAYVERAGEPEVTAAGLASALAARLPAFMVPSAWAVLAALPRTPNGKVDRRALPAPEGATPEAAGYAAPRTPLEERLAAIWAGLLGVGRVGIHDGFFALGGHSLLAVQVVSRLREEMGIELPLRALFDRPTVAALAAAVEARSGADPVSLPVHPAPPGEPRVLSFTQERIWLLDRLEAGTAAYNMPLALRLRGDFDPRSFSAAWNESVRRHEVLRTSFPETPAGPAPEVAPPPLHPLPLADLSGLPPGRREEEAERLAAAEALLSFDLRTGPVLRALLLRLGEGEHRLSATLHHVAGDAWSVGVLVGELNALYAAAREGRPSPLPPLPVQYADFARWQRERLRSGALAGELAWWRERLAGLPAPLELPASRPRSGVARRGGSAAVRLGPELSARLRRLGRAEGATPFMILLAGFEALLARYTGRIDLCVGVPVAGRDRLETEGLLGVFLNTLALRADLSGDPGFREILGRVREASLGALAHRELPFERLLEELRPERDLDRSPLFQVLFNLAGAPEARLALPGVEAEGLPLPPLPPKLDLTVYAAESAGGELDLRLHYDAAVFDAEQMERLGRHLAGLLAAAAGDPARRLSELPLAVETAAVARVAPANDWAFFPPEAVEGSIPGRFAAMAREHAGRPAVLGMDGEAWTYADLDRASGRGASALLAALGEGAETVGLLFAQGAARIAGFLAGLKAGKICVPLDPSYPRARLAFMARDSGAGAVLTDAAHRGLAEELTGGGARVLVLEEVAEGWALPLPEVPPGTPAYILYTSGSTGEPKGVAQSHRNVLHHIRAYTNALRLVPGDRLSLLASFAFDAAVMDVFGALLNGAALCPYDVPGEGTAGLPAWVARQGITVFHSTPTLYRRFLEEAGEAAFPTVRLVVLGGEKSVRGDFERFRRHFGSEALFVNGLGPTESTLALQHFLSRESALGRDTVPVGLPVAETGVRLWNATGEQAALYGVGEIALRGRYLALGYWRRPELTAAAFLPDPEDGEGRVYRTGDLGRWLPDGSLEFVGRADAQVKVRGQRVEPGEVEARLNALPGVGEAVVVAREDASGEARLAAYLLAPAPAAEELRRGLRERLPEAMIPATFTVVPAWPLTPTGKVDRGALPEPAAPAGAGEAEAPRTAAEELVAGIFAELLGAPPASIGRDTDFFALGGHSLLATRLVSRLRRSLGVELSLREVFEAPTVAALAGRIGAALGGAPAAPPLEPLPARAGAPLSFAQERLWFLDRLQPGSAAYVMPAALLLSGALDVTALRASFEEVARRHAVLRATFADDGGAPAQTIQPPAPLPLPLLDLSALPAEAREAEAPRIAREVSRRPFDLESGPLLRLALVRLAGTEHLAVLALHHIAADGWSLGVLAREIAAIYPARLAGKPSPLPELPIQYADFAAWQRAWLAGGVLDHQLAWWRERLSGMPEILELPADRPRRVLADPRAGSRPFALPEGTAARLRQAAWNEGSTLFMLLLAAFQTFLHRLTGEEDLAVGTPVAGRTRVETEGLIGLFANTLVMRGDLSGDPPFRDLLERTREGALAAQARQDLPFEKLVEALRPERGLDRSPLFQVLFVLQNAGGEPARIPGLELRPQALPAAGAKLDLSLSLAEGPDGLSGLLEYAAGLFDAVTVARWEGHLANLLAGLADGGLALPLSALPLLTAAERHQLRAEWCDTAVADERDGLCLHALLLAAAERTPEAVAVVSGEGELLYGELEARSRSLAARLRAEGIGEGSFVPLLLDSGPGLVVGMLAAMRAGAAFVPLDVEWPAARLEEILTELAGPSRGIVLVGAASPSLPTAPGRRAIAVDGAGEEGAAGPLPDPEIADSESPIYAIYTSGSTGRPKAAIVPHRGIVNRFLWMERRFGAAAAERVLQTTRCVYDSVVWQIFWPLTLSGRTVLTPSRLGLDPESLAGLIERHAITMADFVPSIFNVLVGRLADGSEPVSRLASLRAVVVGGEEMEAGAARELRRRLPGVHLVNLYGPTEASIGCICHTVEAEPAGRVPIGRPIHNVAARVLDRAGNPVPVGVAGELGLAGRCVGQGYLGDPGKTRQVFVPDPLAAEGAPMYRTGDRVRWLPDGRLDFLGRIDQQVKIRGLRIEPGEIEAVLRLHPGVGQAAVLAVGASPGDRRLVAWVTPREAGPPPGERDLRSFLAGRLPAALVPAAFGVLESLPLSAGGKVDRRALAALAPGAGGREEAWTAPRTPAEELLAGIWQEVLDAGRPVGIEDDFFALGGHSLLAMRVVSRVRRAFGVELPLRALFEEPTVAGLARRLQEEGEGTAPPPIVPVPRAGDLPLSFAQQRLWFVEQLQSGGSLYNLLLAARLAGPLDAGLLAGALAAVVRRHESLRTSFPVLDGQPVQAIAPAGPVPLPVISLELLPPDRREEELRRWTTAEARRPFDLAAGPLLRCALLRLGEEEHALLVGVHHTVCDGWSIGLLERELGAAYEAGARGAAPVLPELPVQYADYAVWQRERLSGELLEREVAWWRGSLAGMPATLELPADRPRPAVQSFRGARLPVELPAERAEALRVLGRRHGGTLFMTLLAGLDTLLHRYTGEERLVLGTPTAGRTAVEVEPLIGNFASTLLVPVDLGGGPGFGGLLERVREAALAAFVHQEVPFELLVEALSPRRDLSHNPLFQVLFGLHELPPRGGRLGDLELAPLPVESGASRFDLSLDLVDGPGGLRGAFEYATDLFDRATVERLRDHLGVLLDGALEAPDTRLSELPLLTAAERRQLLEEWNGLPAEAPLGQCLHELVEEQARRRPEAEAVVCGGERLTYRELDRRANALAWRLRELGVGPESRVGVHLERSADLAVALLGVLKAGGAYVPLDPAYPARRVGRILESAAPAVLVRGRTDAELPAHGAAEVWLGEEEAEASPASGVSAASLAYVIYTSGSTGQPKGVQVSHGTAAHLMAVARRRFGLGDGDVWTVFHSFAFDFSVWEIWGALALGGRLVIVPLETARSPESFRALLAAERVTVLNQTPSAVRALSEVSEEAPSPALRLLVCGGEAFPAGLAPRLLAWGAPVWNFYGPTEATVWASAERVGEGLGEAETVPLGSPFPGYGLYTVDRGGQALPAGVPGELAISGVGLARGYFGDPGLTAERFVPDPFSGESGARMYRAGDVARRRTDGSLEYLGRIDHQVKVRGFRIELGEIEAALRSEPTVSEAVAVARPDGTGGPRLVAYVVAPEEGYSAEALRSSLRKSLPDYMVPAVLVRLGSMPLSPNGKVDRSALPEPGGLEAGASYVAPRTLEEELLAGLWSELLGVERVGARDNFFSLGGHSLLAVRLASRVRERAGVELPLRSVMETPTLEELAERLSDLRREALPPLPEIVPAPRGGALPLSFAQERLWFLDRFAPESSSLNLPGAVSLRGTLDPQALESALSELARRHEILRTRFEAVGGTPFQAVLPARPVSLPRLDLTALPTAARQRELERLKTAEASALFDLEAAPPWSVRLVRLGESEHVLLVTLHHILTDGWSGGVMVRDLTALYGAAVSGEPPALPGLPVQYADYAHWQRELLRGERLEGELAYWRETLAGAEPLLDLPTDRPRPAVQTYRGERWSTHLPPALALRLRELGARENATLFMILLAVFKVLAHRWSGQEDIVVGSPIAGRGRAELEPLIGLFLNSLVLRTDLSGDPGFREVLGRVRRTTLGAYSHQEVPFEKLLEELRPERDLSRTPLFQVFFNLFNFPSVELAAPGLSLSAQPAAEAPAKFDLTIYVAEGPEGIGLSWVYNRDLFDPATIVEMAEQFGLLARQVAERPEERIGSFPLITEAARAALPDPAVELSAEWMGAVHEVFSRQAARSPERLAVADPNETWTYGELEAQSNRLAHHLLSQGLARQEVVAIYGHRSATLVWTVLGVLKAGGAFVILDPSYPPGRLLDCLRVAGPRGWIELTAAGPVPEAVRAFLEPLPPGLRIALSPGKNDPRLARLSSDDPGIPVGPDDVALIAFTSGSTGLPKGILGRQGPLSHFIPWQCREFGLGGGDRFSMLSGLAHDPLQRDMFTPLQIGGSLCIPDPEPMGEPGWLAGWMAREGITVAHLTPAMGQVLAEGAVGRVPSLRYAFLVGEALTRRDADRLRELAPHVTCVNFYGSTETQRSVGYFVIPVVEEGAGVDRAKQVLPLGKGMRDVQLLVLNRSGAQAGVGELGEIGVRGPHLAQGYLHDAALTAEKFVANPWGHSAEDRVYRTGDLGRYRADGNVVFAGRADHQVKIRGFRIELGEIEATLGLHPALRDVVAAAREDRPGEKRLVAYYVARPGEAPVAAELREYLRERLPHYMVPSAFVSLQALPLTPNRKLDRKALPPPPAEAAEETAGGAPLDAVEERLVEIWSEVLRGGRIGRLDNFFDRGGHSLLATQLVARVRDAFGVELPLRSLFEAPTVAGMAESLRAGEEGGLFAAALPRIVPSLAERNEPFPLTDVQEAYWIGRSGGFDLGTATHVYFEVEGSRIDVERFGQVWRRLIERHDMLRAIVLPDGRQQILSEVPEYRIEVLDLSGETPEESETALLEVREEMSHQVLPSDRWPLFDLRATRLSSGRTRLHVSIDMLIGDALSFRILQREVLALYRDPEAMLEPLELSFRDYVVAVAGLEGSEVWQRSLAYWRERLKTLPPAPELPLAVSPSSVEKPHFARRSGGLDPETWTLLKERAGRAGITPSGVLLAAYGELLAAWSKSPRFTINLTLFNRLPLHPQVQSVVGDFTSLTLLEIDASAGESFEERARRLQGQLWSDLDHRHVSGVRVMREARASRGSLVMPVVFTSTLGMAQPPAAALQELLDTRWIYGISQTSQVWLDHQVTEREGALRITWDAVEDLFPAGFLNEAFAAYLPFLNRLAHDEEAWKASALSLVPQEQLAPRLAANATAGPVPEGLLHSGFLEQAERRPFAPAVVSLTRVLSYQDLERRSLHLAGELRRRGARPGALVGVVMEKGWEQVVAVLAILRAGAAYLPIDPNLPAERLGYLLEHGQVEIALTQSWVDEELAWPEGVARLRVDTAPPAGPGEPPLPAAQSPEDLAYVIFTSGSTGLPKGVMIDHRGALNTVIDVNRRFGVGPGDRVLALSALNFDLSVWDLFGILGAGGTVVLPEPGASRDPGRWLELIAEEGVTVWDTVPALMEMLVEYARGQGSEALSTLRLVMMSGDWIPLSLPPRIKALAPEAEIFGLGGATEASIWSNWYPASEVDPSWRSVPYGWPLTNQGFHVLDEKLRPRPTWVPGQLYIGGIGLAKGYWRDEAKTNASFIIHPVTGERLYRTGDGGRYLPDGSIEFLGREDFQVKIQGYRIELGEIETALTQHPGVRAAVVTAAGDRSSRRLVAYVVPELAPHREEAAPKPEAGPSDPGALLQKAQRLELKMKQGAVREEADRPFLQLSKPASGRELADAYQLRRSHRSFLAGTVPSEALEQLLANLMRIEAEGSLLAKYRYPSAGSLYPVQTYLHVKPGRIAGIAGGVYYYNPRDHRLVLITPDAELDRELHAQVNREAFDGAAFSLFLVGVLPAIEPVYGELARDFCLLEAGAMIQLLMTAAPEAGLGLCPIGRMDFEPVRRYFALGDGHVLLHTLVGGQPARAGAQASPGLADLRGFLEGKLPRYMVPSAFVMLDELPLTANGKVDRQALPEPREPQMKQMEKPRAAATAPQGEVEERLGEILKEILQTRTLGAHDNFFELGGTSVHIVRAHARIREVFQRDIPMMEMFSNPTLHALARRIAGVAEAPPPQEQEAARVSKLAEGRSRLRQRSLRQNRGD